MTSTKTLKQLAEEYSITPQTLKTWLCKQFPDWYNESPQKRTYTPKEIKLIYDNYGHPNSKELQD